MIKPAQRLYDSAERPDVAAGGMLWYFGRLPNGGADDGVCVIPPFQAVLGCDAEVAQDDGGVLQVQTALQEDVGGLDIAVEHSSPLRRISGWRWIFGLDAVVQILEGAAELEEHFPDETFGDVGAGMMPPVAFAVFLKEQLQAAEVTVFHVETRF